MPWRCGGGPAYYHANQTHPPAGTVISGTIHATLIFTFFALNLFAAKIKTQKYVPYKYLSMEQKSKFTRKKKEDFFCVNFENDHFTVHACLPAHLYYYIFGRKLSIILRICMKHWSVFGCLFDFMKLIYNHFIQTKFTRFWVFLCERISWGQKICELKYLWNGWPYVSFKT